MHVERCDICPSLLGVGAHRPQLQEPEVAPLVGIALDLGIEQPKACKPEREHPFDDGDETSLADKLGEDDAGFAELEDGSLVAAGLDALDDRERRIVELRFFEEKTQSQIAAEVGISQMHVSRLLRSALATMRGRIEEVATTDG